jgi:Uncharacterized protein conserved in bacteria
MSAKRRNPQPLTATRLEELALAYVARFATTQARLRSYLQRKVRERGWADDGEPLLEALVSKHAQAGYVDDQAWARMKTGSMLRRGYGARRVGEALGHAGIGQQIRSEVEITRLQQHRAAIVLARRRRFGPFAVQPLDRPVREKQLAAMLRAGHPLDIARMIVDADDPATLEEWAESACGDD